MSSTEEYQDSPTSGLQIPGLVQSQESVEQLSFANPSSVTPFPDGNPSAFGPISSPGSTGMGAGPASHPGFAIPVTPTPDSAPGTTRALLWEAQPAVTHALRKTHSLAESTPQRRPIVISGSGKRTHSIRPPQGRRHVISIAALTLMMVVLVGTLVVVSPIGHDFGLGPSTGSSTIHGGNSTNLSLVQQATATAIVHQQSDGYDPGASGGAPAYNTNGSPYPWPVGVCTYWANVRYHQLTGDWVSWDGNAYQWGEGATLAGWNVSSTPHVPSIIVLQPGVQGASGYGHVAVVESIVNSTTVRTSNMNWYDGGGFDIVSYYNFTVGPGVLFVWHK